uniref:Retrovirus-related Pol polyprotein from transposon TNT 1-94 n=1 Tax=Cajanus cajan TaxID=3821 RepID=A0A151SJG1_CAJCA|nr:hypothetical protein KK1_001141 [Cajanus cajan]
MLLTWLQSTLSKSILSCVIGSVHSYQVWDKVHEYFHTQTKARARQLRTDLCSTTLDGQSMRDFLTQIKTIADELAGVGNPMSLEYVDVVLEGLPQEYAPVVSVIESKFVTPPIAEVEALLLAPLLELGRWILLCFHRRRGSVVWLPKRWHWLLSQLSNRVRCRLKLLTGLLW